MYSTPLAYFITFTTYGTWLHGDPRGFVYDQTTARSDSKGTTTIKGRVGIQSSDPVLYRHSQEKLNYPPVFLPSEARDLVDVALRQLAHQRHWHLHELNVRSNHVHVAVTAGEETPEKVMADMKAKGTRVLRESGFIEKERKVWTEHGSTLYLFQEEQFHSACRYIREQ